MQTYENVLLAKLQDYGLSEEEAKATLEEFYKTKAVDFNRVKDNMEDYGPHAPLLLKILWISLRSVTYEWIKKNHPFHFALAIFSDEDPEKIIEKQAKELEKKLEADKEAGIDSAESVLQYIHPKHALTWTNMRRPNMQQISRKKE